MPSEPRRSRSLSPGPERLLGIYLNDHYAGSAGGIALVRRMARVPRSGPAGPRLEELAEEIAEDQESLVEIMTALDVPVKRARNVVVRFAEKVGRLKPNGRVVSRSPLSEVLELEALRLGVQGKLALWHTLTNLARSDDRIDSAAVERLVARVERQIGLLEGMRLAAVDRTFAPGSRAALHEPATRRGWLHHSFPRTGGAS
ncbi:hypothetical protein [Streptomyces sp. NBC_01353]|uniref:hypothetical protein n=1 Tax=Streptomyces sp. NBC_01353 TaxID=2903835 RepID=UPI002E355CB2|nr:hypothetical protein [Streptomyces sp. NBC_01353]